MKVKDVIVCDDIRQEIGGKMTLAGVYSGGLLVDAATPFPVLMKSLCLYVRLVLEDDDPSPDEFTFRGSFNGEQAIEKTGPIEVINRNDPVTVRLMFSPFELRGLGQITFEVSFASQGKTIATVTEHVPVKAPPTG